MKSLVLEPANYTPRVIFKPEGDLSIKGRSLMLDAVSFYRPLIEWASQLCIQTINFSIELDYFNTCSSRKLLDLLNVIDNNNNIREFNVIWRFEPDDEETLEKGQIFEEKLRNARFQYKALSEI